MRWLRRAVGAAVVLALLLAGGGWWWLGHPLALEGERAEVSIEPGTSAREAARLWVVAGVRAHPEALYQ